MILNDAELKRILDWCDWKYTYGELSDEDEELKERIENSEDIRRWSRK